jgi:hypothetical protein
MKLKKFVKKYITLRTRLIIIVADGVDTKRLVSTDILCLYDKYANLLNCKILQIEPDNGALKIIVTEPKNEIH